MRALLFTTFVSVPLVVIVLLAFVASSFWFWMVLADVAWLVALYSGWIEPGYGMESLLVTQASSIFVFLYSQAIDKAYCDYQVRETTNELGPYLGLSWVLCSQSVMPGNEHAFAPAFIMVTFLVIKYMVCRFNRIVGWPPLPEEESP